MPDGTVTQYQHDPNIKMTQGSFYDSVDAWQVQNHSRGGEAGKRNCNDL